ncbi:MAG: response regulator transcription factor [Armatimonadetes bacterium]|nr:response regulator transcription factor [Armatimonadota bacterium]
MDVASDDHAALAMAEAPVDLVLLDPPALGLDGGSGCRLLRGRSPALIIVLSDRGEEEDVVAALDAGADDYLVKPIRLEELAARVGAVLRRSGGSFPLPARRRELSCGDLSINVSRRRVMVRDREIRLTPIEYAVLTELARHCDQVLTIQHLLQRACQPGDAGRHIHAPGPDRHAVRSPVFQRAEVPTPTGALMARASAAGRSASVAGRLAPGAASEANAGAGAG